jgi:4-amino-4-deoxy-L-arabinose transferase-like glycosyltransferase
MGLSYLGFGVSERAARLPGALAAVAGVLLTWAIGRNLFGDRPGFLGGLVLLTSFGYFILARQAPMDPLFTCATSLSFYCFVRHFSSPRASPLYSLLFACSMALAVLTKGLLGFFPLLVIAIYLLCIGRLGHFWNMTPVWGGLLFGALTVPWHLAMGRQNEGFFWHYFMNEQILRFFGRRHFIDYTPLSLPLLWLILFLWLAPWSTYLPLAVLANPVRTGRRLDRPGGGGLLIWLWAAAILGLFSLSRARLHQYLLPAMPALGLLIGKSLDERWAGKGPSTRGLVALSALSLLLLALGFALVPAAVQRYYDLGPSEQTATLSRGFFGTLIVGSGLATLAFSRRRWTIGISGIVCSVLASFVIAHQGLVLLEPSQSSKLLAALINKDRRPGKMIVLNVEKEEPFEYETVAGLAFYTGQKVYLLRQNNPPTFPLPLRPGEGFMLSAAEFQRWWRSAGLVYVVTDTFEEEGSILDQHAPVFVVGRVAQRWVLSNHAIGSKSSNASFAQH